MGFNQLGFSLYFLFSPEARLSAEAQGFEPRLDFHLIQFSRLTHSTALPNLLFSRLGRISNNLLLYKYMMKKLISQVIFALPPGLEPGT